MAKREVMAPRQKVVGTCTWCRGPVPPHRRTWCSAACVFEYQVRADPRVARRALRQRDREVCLDCGMDCRWLAQFLRRLGALEVVVRTEEVARMLRWTPIPPPAKRLPFGREMPAQIVQFFEDPPEPEPPRWGPVRHRTTTDGRVVKLGRDERPYISWREWWCCELMGLSLHDARRRSYWEADHVVPVAEGGGELGLENLVTRCIWCHRRKTTRDVRRIRSKKKSAPISQVPSTNEHDEST